MIQIIQKQISDHRHSGVYLDTNLLLVLAIGNYAPDRLQTFKRTMAYDIRDYRLLVWLMRRFERRLTTPNILTEVDNLSRQMPEGEHEAVAKSLRGLVRDMFEIYHESRPHLDGELHRRVGLTDAVLMAQAETHLVVTADFRLANRIEKRKGHVINFNHIRKFAPKE